MKKTLGLICGIFFLVYCILALAEEIQPLNTEIKDLSKEAEFHAELDSYNILYSLTEDEGYAKGKDIATEDFRNGNYRVLVYGLRGFDMPSEKYLRETYNVETYPIAGCIVSDGIVGGAKGYNTIMKALLREKHGKDIFKEAEVAEGGVVNN